MLQRVSICIYVWLFREPLVLLKGWGEIWWSVEDQAGLVIAKLSQEL